MGGVGVVGVALGVGTVPPSEGPLDGAGFVGLVRLEAPGLASDGSEVVMAVSAGSASAGAVVEGLVPFGSAAAASGGSSVVRAKKTPTITAAKPSIATMPIAMPMATPLLLLEGVLAAGVASG